MLCSAPRPRSPEYRRMHSRNVEILPRGCTIQKNPLHSEESSGRSTSESVGKPQLCPEKCSVPFAHLSALIKLWINHERLGRRNSHPTGTFQPQPTPGKEPGVTLTLHLCSTRPLWAHPGMDHWKKQRDSTTPGALVVPTWFNSTLQLGGAMGDMTAARKQALERATHLLSH